MSAPGLSLIWVRKRTVAKARFWPLEARIELPGFMLT